MITKLTNSFATSESVVLGFDLVVHGVAHGWRTTCTLEVFTQTHSRCVDPFQEFKTVCAIGQEVRLEPRLPPTDPLAAWDEHSH